MQGTPRNCSEPMSMSRFLLFKTGTSNPNVVGNLGIQSKVLLSRDFAVALLIWLKFRVPMGIGQHIWCKLHYCKWLYWLGSIGRVLKESHQIGYLQSIHHAVLSGQILVIISILQCRRVGGQTNPFWLLRPKVCGKKWWFGFTRRNKLNNKASYVHHMWFLDLGPPLLVDFLICSCSRASDWGLQNTILDAEKIIERLQRKVMTQLGV